MKSFLIIFFITFSYGVSAASEAANLLENHLKKLIKKEVSNECQSCDVVLQIHNRDSVDDIAIPDQVISDRWKGQTNLLLKIGKQTRVITVTIRWFDSVVVAKRNIKQGTVLTEKDLRTVNKDVTYLKVAYLQDIENAQGWVGRRIFKRGQIIDEAALSKPLVIRFGQTVKVVMNEGQLELLMTGKARGAGAIGDRIPVFIPGTRKKITAVVIDKNTTRLE